MNYKLRDWGVSRQRYWGCPIPILYCKNCGTVPVPYEDLPVSLPDDVDFSKGGNPLETSKTFLNVKCPKCGKLEAKRETDTMDTFVDSSWYFFRYCDPDSNDIPYRKKILDYWGKDTFLVDQYIGGIEHAILHLIYARFWTKVGRDIELHSFDEPFRRLLTQGMINKAHPFCTNCNRHIMRAELKEMMCKRCGNKDLILKSVKMSKSYGNTVEPKEIVDKYGADAARFFILFGASPESGLEWSDEGVDFAHKYIKNVLSLLTDEIERQHENKTILDDLMEYNLHKTLMNITTFMEKNDLRDAINELIQFTSLLSKYKLEGVHPKVFTGCCEILTKMLHPFIPHITEELWNYLGKEAYLSLSNWPKYECQFITEENQYKWSLLNETIDSINHIKYIIKKDRVKEILLITADSWKYQFLSELLSLVNETKDMKEIMNTLMRKNIYKKHGKFASQTVSSVLKNLGKFFRPYLDEKQEFNFFQEIAPILKLRFNCNFKVISEKDSKEAKAKQALPGRPAIIIY